MKEKGCTRVTTILAWKKPNNMTWNFFWQQQAKYFGMKIFLPKASQQIWISIFPTKSIKFQAGFKSQAKSAHPLLQAVFSLGNYDKNKLFSGS